MNIDRVINEIYIKLYIPELCENRRVTNTRGVIVDSVVLGDNGPRGLLL